MISHFPNKRRRLSRILLLPCLKDIVSYFMIRWQILFWYVILRRDVCIHIFWTYTKTGITKAKLYSLTQICSNRSQLMRILRVFKAVGFKAQWMLSLDNLEAPQFQAVWKQALARGQWTTSKAQPRPLLTSKLLQVYLTKIWRCSWSPEKMKTNKLQLKRWVAQSSASFQGVSMTRLVNIKYSSAVCTTRQWCSIFLLSQVRFLFMSLILLWRLNIVKASK